MTLARHGPFWDMIEGRRPAPAAAPAPPGKLYGRARVVHRGRDIMFLEGALARADGAVVATATATARIIPFADVTAHAPAAS